MINNVRVVGPRHAQEGERVTQNLKTRPTTPPEELNPSLRRSSRLKTKAAENLKPMATEKSLKTVEQPVERLAIKLPARVSNPAETQAPSVSRDPSKGMERAPDAAAAKTTVNQPAELTAGSKMQDVPIRKDLG
ncbi:hypothetical protein BDZ89DRAFT_1055087 [Hymenopellis radicata]|nr:hypothetical protein BDZ89DRAFT_1055087 [Hymenopellis radicata]